MAPKPRLLISSGSKKKEPRYTCLSEAKALHSHSMWAEVSSLTPHFLNKGLSCSPSRWRCLLRVLWPVSRPVTTLDWILLKVKNFALVPRLGPETSSRACRECTGYNFTKKERKPTPFNVKKRLTITIYTQSVTNLPFLFTYPLCLFYCYQYLKLYSRGYNFSKNLGGTSKYWMPEGRNEASRILRIHKH